MISSVEHLLDSKESFGNQDIKVYTVQSQGTVVVEITKLKRTVSVLLVHMLSQ